MTTFDLIANIFCVAVLPVLIALEVKNRHAPKSPMSAYLWVNHPRLTVLGLAFLATLAVMCGIDLAGYFGLLAADVVKVTQTIVGLPMLAMSLAIIVLGARAFFLARSKS